MIGHATYGDDVMDLFRSPFRSLFQVLDGKRIVIRRALALPRALTCTGTLVLIALTASAAAQTADFHPAQAIRIIVPYPAGGGNDIMARITSAAIGQRLGQPFLVLNRSGAEGTIGSEVVARAEPDGYTIGMFSADTHSIIPHVYRNTIRYPAADFVAITPVAMMVYALVGRRDLEADSLQELIALAQTRQLSYSNWGIANSSTLAMEAFMQAISAQRFLGVPYQGAAPASMGLVTGQVDVMMMPVPIALAQGENLKHYGVVAEQRSAALPDVPTLREQGIDVVTEAWIGLLAPPKTPRHIADSLAASLMQALSAPETRASIEKTGLAPMAMDARGFAQYLAAQSQMWADIVEKADIRLD